jgi:hypothetical protein
MAGELNSASEEGLTNCPDPGSAIMDMPGLDDFANATGRLAAVLSALNHKKC